MAKRRTHHTKRHTTKRHTTKRRTTTTVKTKLSHVIKTLQAIKKAA